MKFQIKIETDDGRAFQCVVDDIRSTRMQDAIDDILSVAFNKVIEAYKAHDEDMKE